MVFDESEVASFDDYLARQENLSQNLREMIRKVFTIFKNSFYYKNSSFNAL